MAEFYRDYDPPLLPGRYTCVGLAGDLATRLAVLETQYPGLKDATYQVRDPHDALSADTLPKLNKLIPFVMIGVKSQGTTNNDVENKV